MMFSLLNNLATGFSIYVSEYNKYYCSGGTHTEPSESLYLRKPSLHSKTFGISSSALFIANLGLFRGINNEIL